MPRPLCGTLISVLYCPPETCADKQREFVHYLSETIDCARNTSPDCGIIALDDYNLDVNDLLNQQNLTQVMKDPTRLNATLDLVITNMQSRYTQPKVTASIRSSDHNTVFGTQKLQLIPSVTKRSKTALYATFLSQVLLHLAGG